MSEQLYEMDLQTFANFSAPMVGLEVTHVWRGYGSALFLEMGKLTSRMRRNGTPGNPKGEMELMIEWSWRIEDENHILGGSWSDENTWPNLFARLLGTRVSAVSLFARLPEVQLKFSNGLYLCSLMTADGDPDWAIFDRREGKVESVGVRAGKLYFEREGNAKMSEVRLKYGVLAPEGLAKLRELEHYLNNGAGIEASLRELVRLRVSQLNGCEFCVRFHTAEMTKLNETAERIASLQEWRSSELYTKRERAALAWAEAVTNIQDGHAPDVVYEAVRAEFTDVETVNLTLVITTINAWNRISIALGAHSSHGSEKVPVER